MLMFRLETKRTVDHEHRELGYQLKFSLQDTATEFDAKCNADGLLKKR